MNAENFRSAAFVAGVALISFGAWQIYPPAGYIVAGVVLAGVAAIGHFRGPHG